MRIAYSVLLLFVGFGTGAAVDHVSHHAPPPPAATASPTAPAPTTAGGAGERDPKADLRDQMMWDPSLEIYLGG